MNTQPIFGLTPKILNEVKMIDFFKDWLEFLTVLMIKGIVVTLTGWFTIQILSEVWKFNGVFTVILGMVLLMSIGFLISFLEKTL